MTPESFGLLLGASGVTHKFFDDYDPKTNQFSDTPHSALYEYAMLHYEQYKRPPDHDTIVTELNANANLDTFKRKEISALLQTLRQYDANPNGLPLLIDMVRDKYLEDQYNYTFQVNYADLKTSGIAKTIANTMTALSGLTAKTNSRDARGAKSAEQFANSVIEEMKTADDHGNAKARFGYRRWDSWLGGMYDGEITLIAGGTGTGKSWLLSDVGCFNAIELGKRVVFWNVEMLERQIARRIMCRQTGITFNRLRHGYDKLTDEEKERFNLAQQAIRDMKDRVLFLDKSRCTNVVQARAEIIQHFGANNPPDLMVADYLDKIQASRNNAALGDHERVSRVLNEFTELAGEIGFAGFSATQLNRAGNAKTNPTRMDLSIFQAVKDAANIIIITPDPENPYQGPQDGGEEPGKPGILQARIEKSRMGTEHAPGADPFRLLVEFATASISEPNSSSFTRTATASAFTKRYDVPPAAACEDESEEEVE